MESHLMTRDQTIACTAHAHKLSQEMDFEFESTSKILFDVETNHTAEIYPILSGLKEYGYIDMTRDQNGHDHHFWLATTRERATNDGMRGAILVVRRTLWLGLAM
jgi:hypothetical protein